MRTPHPSLLAFAAALACTVDAQSPPPVVTSGPDYVVEGELPEGVDLEALTAQLPEGGFGVVADPGTGRVATLVSTSSPLARVASGEFSVSVAASCTDCGDPTCASTSRTIAIGLSHDSGVGGESYSIQTASSLNFSAPVTTPDAWVSNVGDTVHLSTTGTLPACAPFGHFFDVIGPDAPEPEPFERLLFTEYHEGSSNNKYLEITNNGTLDHDLSDCDVLLYSNGAAAPTATISLSGTLSVGDVYLICHTSAALVTGGPCDQTTGSLSFNGDDALELDCGGHVYDTFGQVGFDPGSSWGSMVESVNASLVRDCAIVDGDPDATDAFDPADEWIDQGLDMAGNLGLPNVCP